MRIAKYYNSKRTRGPVLKKRDKTYLLKRNIKTTGLNEKLDCIKLGLFCEGAAPAKFNHYDN